MQNRRIIHICDKAIIASAKGEWVADLMEKAVHEMNERSSFWV